jgi:hypothetical protein
MLAGVVVFICNPNHLGDRDMKVVICDHSGIKLARLYLKKQARGGGGG